MISKYLLLIYLAPITKCSDVIDASNMFASNLYKKLERPSDNLLFSPFSIFTMLALIREGATGQTETLLRKSLHLPDKKVTSKQYRDILLATYENATGTMEIAPKLYTKKGNKWRDRFQRLARDYYHCEVRTESLTRLEKTAEDVNVWVENESNGAVRDVVVASYLNSHFEMLAVNAIYLNGTWEIPFEVEQIQRLPFYKTEKATVQRNFLQNTGTYEYFESDEMDAQCLKLNYKDRRYSMTIILPNQRTGIKKINSLLDITRVNMKMQWREVRATIPIFKYEAVHNMAEVLPSLGMGDIFVRDDLTDMIEGSKNLTVTKFVQMIKIELNKGDTKLGSATAEKGPSYKQASTVLEFTADHPFLFTINLQVSSNVKPQKQKYVILFVGKVNTPKIID